MRRDVVFVGLLVAAFAVVIGSWVWAGKTRMPDEHRGNPLVENK